MYGFRGGFKALSFPTVQHFKLEGQRFAVQQQKIKQFQSLRLYEVVESLPTESGKIPQIFRKHEKYKKTHACHEIVLLA